VWIYLILYYVMLIDESQVFELYIERKFEVCTTIQTSFLSTVLMHEFHASTSYTVHMYFNNYYSLNPNGLWVNSNMRPTATWSVIEIIVVFCYLRFFLLRTNKKISSMPLKFSTRQQ